MNLDRFTNLATMAIAFAVVLIVGGLFAMTFVNKWRETPRANGLPKKRGWADRNARSIRSPLPRRVIADRLTNYLAARPDHEGIRLLNGRIDRTIFRIEYGQDRDRYAVSGRILQGSSDQLVVLRFERRMWPWWSLVLGCAGGVTATSSGHGPWTVFLPWRDAPGLFALVIGSVAVTGIVLPMLRRVPNELVDTVSDALCTEFEGVAE